MPSSVPSHLVTTTCTQRMWVRTLPAAAPSCRQGACEVRWVCLLHPGSFETGFSTEQTTCYDDCHNHPFDTTAETLNLANWERT